MRKSNLFLLFLMVFILVYAGCAEKQITKIEGTSSAQNESVIKQTEQPSTSGKLEKQNLQTNVDEKSQDNSQEKAMGISSAAQNLYKLANIHFDFDRYSIRPEDRKILSSHADFFLKNRNGIIIIEGHCDERGTAEYNLALGNRRAEEAKRFLINSGISPSRIKTISYGEEKPLDTAHNEEAWAENRRDHFVINN